MALLGYSEQNARDGCGNALGVTILSYDEKMLELGQLSDQGGGNDKAGCGNRVDTGGVATEVNVGVALLEGNVGYGDRRGNREDTGGVATEVNVGVALLERNVGYGDRCANEGQTAVIEIERGVAKNLCLAQQKEVTNEPIQWPIHNPKNLQMSTTPAGGNHQNIKQSEHLCFDGFPKMCKQLQKPSTSKNTNKNCR